MLPVIDKIVARVCWNPGGTGVRVRRHATGDFGNCGVGAAGSWYELVYRTGGGLLGLRLLPGGWRDAEISVQARCRFGNGMEGLEWNGMEWNGLEGERSDTNLAEQLDLRRLPTTGRADFSPGSPPGRSWMLLEFSSHSRSFEAYHRRLGWSSREELVGPGYQLAVRARRSRPRTPAAGPDAKLFDAHVRLPRSTPSITGSCSGSRRITSRLTSALSLHIARAAARTRWPPAHDLMLEADAGADADGCCSTRRAQPRRHPRDDDPSGRGARPFRWRCGTAA